MAKHDEMTAVVTRQRHAFLEAVAEIRPRLHRYCTKMTGSVLDGEDVVQETLSHAFFRLQTLSDPNRMAAWLFRIAHNKAIDHLRKKKGDRIPWEDAPEVEAPADVDRIQVAEALTRVVTHLPPKERACVVLKDVLGYSLADIAEIVDSTLGGVKSALHRGRSKLALTPSPLEGGLDSTEQRLVAAYIERFNHGDWDGVLSLIGADVRLEVVDRAATTGRDAIAKGYFGNYQRLPWRWRLRLCRVDGVIMLIHWREDGAGWRPHAPIVISSANDTIHGIKDFVHVDYLLDHAHVEALDRP